MKFKAYNRHLEGMSDDALINELRVLSELEKAYLSLGSVGRGEVARLRGRRRLVEKEISKRKIIGVRSP